MSHRDQRHGLAVNITKPRSSDPWRIVIGNPRLPAGRAAESLRTSGSGSLTARLRRERRQALDYVAAAVDAGFVSPPTPARKDGVEAFRPGGHLRVYPAAVVTGTGTRCQGLHRVLSSAGWTSSRATVPAPLPASLTDCGG
jgi:hypothetical protein